MCDGDQFLQRPDCLEGSLRIGGRLLFRDDSVPEQGSIPNDLSDKALGGVNRSKHRGGSRTRKYGSLHSISAHCSRFPERIGNAPDLVRESGLDG
ncbi:hypothetical protein MES4922_30186 [Mesorhizobium ventifaucium]|uniref:Uncharacterized protein n=1 Tax=Mesorhizobium ventifaucium TaxID=666020 RepID=A0ABM9DXV9_9HYPH|nr:hypothetical protein MES4922_30186 [Mesorhizobium ventifaucium]